jgi:hypothetical protein
MRLGVLSILGKLGNKHWLTVVTIESQRRDIPTGCLRLAPAAVPGCVAQQNMGSKWPAD